MSDGARVVLIVFGCLAAIAALLVGAGAYWWSTHGEALMEESRIARSEGQAYGSTVDNEACMEAGLERFDQCDGFAISCQIALGIYLRSCLESSQPTPGFCEGVPAETAILDSATWRIERCETAGRSGNFCNEFFGHVQRHCDRVRAGS